MSTAIQPSSFTLQPAPQGIAFIPLDEAARRGGYKSVGSLRHRLKEWIPAGLARQARVKGRKPYWEVREDADPRFARVKFPEQMPFDMSAVPAAQRGVILAREQALKDWEAAIAKGFAAGLTKRQATDQFVSLSREIDGVKISRSQLYEWQSAYRAQGRAGLQDDRKNRAQASRDEGDPFFIELKKFYLRLSQPKLKTCYDHVKLIAEDQGWNCPSFKKCQRYVKKLPPQLVVKMRLGDKAFEETVVPGVRRNYGTLASNQIWCSDHHQLDVIVKGPDGRHCRPWLTAWEDMRSRKIVGFHLFCHDPNQDTILIAFRDGVRKNCVPEGVYIDNGKDFDSWTLQGQTKKERLSYAGKTSWVNRRIRVNVDLSQVGGLFGALKCNVVHARPYNAKAKPIERFFSTLKTRFSQMLWPTYCGGKPDEKPEDLMKQIDRGNAPAFDDFSAAFATWVDADYNARVHEGDGLDGRTPEAAWEDHLVTRRTCAAADLELLLQKSSQPLAVTNQGVNYQRRFYGKGDPQLDRYFGQKIYLRVDPADIRKASAWTLSDQLIGFVSMDAGISWNATEQEFREAEGQRQRVRRLVKDFQQLGPRKGFDTIRLMQEKRARDLAAKKKDGDRTPPSIQPIRTPIEGQLEALQEARKPLALRLAAGAENIELPQGRKSILDIDIDLPATPRPGGSILKLAEME